MFGGGDGNPLTPDHHHHHHHAGSDAAAGQRSRGQRHTQRRPHPLGSASHRPGSDPDAVAAAAAVRVLERLIEQGNWSLVLDLHSTRKNRTGFFALYRGGAHAARTLGPAMHEFASRWCVHVPHARNRGMHDVRSTKFNPRQLRQLAVPTCETAGLVAWARS